MEEILVVDDEWDLAEVVIYLLQGEGYAALYAPNGEAALQLLSKRPVDLVCDYMMPVMNGCELLRNMQSREDLAGIPVVVLSALPEDVVRSHCEPVKEFLGKPFRADQLVQLVRDAFPR